MTMAALLFQSYFSLSQYVRERKITFLINGRGEGEGEEEGRGRGSGEGDDKKKIRRGKGGDLPHSVRTARNH